MAHPNRLQNTHVLVFGGTSGIGFGVASMALSNNAHVTISGSTQQKVDAKVEELRSLYPNTPKENVAGYACDLNDLSNMEANLTAVFDKVTSGGKKVDHIAFTAGNVVALPKIQDVTAETALEGFKVRYIAGLIIGKILSKGIYMPVSAASSFTLTTGTNTLKPLPGWSAGAAWGAATDGLARGLAVDLKPIRVNVVAPGFIDTPLLQKYIERVGEETASKNKEGGSLMQTWGTPVDEAEAYAWFMKDRFVSGAVAQSDGGRLLM